MTTVLDQKHSPTPAWDGALEPLGDTFRGGAPPRVTLGHPTTWDAAAAVKSELGRAWTAPTDDRSYTLIGLACTLHPPADDNDRYTEARFEAYLRPRYGAGTAVAHDLFPLRQTVQDQGKAAVGLTPELKFAKAIEVKLLEIGVEKEFVAAFPVIQAFGLGEPNPYWRFQGHDQFPLQGSQKLYLLAAGPSDAPLVLRLNLIATVQHRRWGLIRYGQPQTARDRLTFEVAPAG